MLKLGHHTFEGGACRPFFNPICDKRCERMTIGKIAAITLACAAIQGCAYTSVVPSANGSAEIMPSRVLNEDTAVRIGPDLAGLRQKVNIGHMCSAHTYMVDAGPAIAESILQTLEGGFRNVHRTDSQPPLKPDTFFLDFSLSEFVPRLRFTPGFFIASADATTELAIKVRATAPNGTLAYQTTARGEGRADTTGGCDIGEQVVTDATRKAVQRTMEDLAQKLINSGILQESL